MLLLILSSCMISCTALPEHIRRNMNENVNPCEDFYEFACGNWSEGHRGNLDDSYIAHLDHRYNKELRNVLEEQRQWDQEPRFVQQLRNHYLSCRGLRNNYDAVQLMRILYEREGNAIWLNVFIRRDNSGWDRYLIEHVADDNDPEQWLLMHRLMDAAFLRVLLGHVAEFVPLTRRVYNRLYSALEPLNMPKGTLWQLIKKLEERIVDVLNYNASTIDFKEQKQLEEEAEAEAEKKEEQQQLEWERMLLPVLGYKRWPDRAITVHNLLAQQPTKLMRSYLRLRLLHRLKRLPLLRFTRIECASETRSLLPHAADWLLEQQLSQEQRHQRRSQVLNLFIQLRQQFEHQIGLNRNHFDEPTQSFLLQKLREMHLRVGLMPAGQPMAKPDWTVLDMMEQQLLEQDYASLQLNASNYFGNLWAIAKKYKPRPKSKSKSPSVEINEMMIVPPIGFSSHSITYFIPRYKMLVVPKSLLASPFYQQPHQDAVDRLSYLGFLLAHEMSHALSLDRKLFARPNHVGRAMGKLFQSKPFDSKLNHLISKYKGKSEEKFCDFNGIDLAYGVFVAQQPQQQQQHEQQPQEQQQQEHRHFFLNFAQYFCGEELRKHRKYDDQDDHGSNRNRVNDAVASLKDFFIAFGCPNATEQRNLQLF